MGARSRDVSLTARTLSRCFADRMRVKARLSRPRGKVKEVVGKVTGDRKLEGEGKADQFKGKVQSAVGELKDTLRGR
jgi:uncharacterized protein YjbJ (UPF0337 family)